MMMTTIRFIFLLGLSITLLEADAQNKNKRTTAGIYDTNFEAVCEGVGTQGTQLFKVYFYFKKEKNAGLYAKENAVKVVLFQGIPTGSGCVKRGLVTQKEYEVNIEYFEEFFNKGGPYQMYVNLISDSMMERVKMPKRTYKAAWVVSVNYDNLRRRLEEDGIISGLGDGF
jgi:hypothetical protein